MKWYKPMELFTDYTLRTVALGAAILGIVSGVLGCFAVLRRQALLGDAMSHAALPGIAIAFMLTGRREPLVLLLGAAVAAWLAALLMMAITRTTRVKEDSGLALILAVFFGLGLMLLSWLQQRPDAAQAGLKSFLFGQAAALVERDLWVMAGLGLPALLCVALFWKQFKLLSFDPEYAISLGLPVQGLSVFLTTLIVVAIVIGLQTVGVVLMSAMLVAPAAAARQWTNRLGIMVLLAALFGAGAGVAGAAISATTRGMATGPTIVLCLGAITLVSLLLAPQRGLLWNWLRGRQALAPAEL
jgi:manganese/zinc/iron transport system permease protein